jgi:hypothetical protein
MVGVVVVEGTCSGGWQEMVRVVLWGARRRQDKQPPYTEQEGEERVEIDQEATAHKE